MIVTANSKIIVKRMWISYSFLVRAVAATAAAAVAAPAQVALGENERAAFHIVVFFGFECALEQGDIDGLKRVGEFEWDGFAGEDFGMNQVSEELRAFDDARAGTGEV